MKTLLPLFAILLLSVAACKKADNSEEENNIRYCPSIYDSYTLLTNTDTAFCFVPNAFTPDYDGRDDLFAAATWNIASISVTVKDGNTVVFQTDSIGARWDGKINGQAVSQKNYDYTVSGTDIYGHSFNLTGTVSLMLLGLLQTDEIKGKVNCDSCRFISEWGPFYDYPVEFNEGYVGEGCEEQ